MKYELFNQPMRDCVVSQAELPDNVAAVEWAKDWLRKNADGDCFVVERTDGGFAANLIRSAGGLPVLAHPGFFDDDDFLERLLDRTPLRGIEVHHRYRSDTKHLRYAAVARRRDLVMTGGSDYHGDDHPRNAGVGRYLTPPREWARLAGLIGR